MQEIQPPKKVVEAMHKVIVADREKLAAKDFANAEQIKADGEKRAAIEMAKGEKQAEILKAEGRAESIKKVNEAASKYFQGNAVELKKLETMEGALKNNTKYVLDPNSKLTAVLSDMANLVPIRDKNGE